MKKTGNIIFAMALFFSCKQEIKPAHEKPKQVTVNSGRNYVYTNAAGQRVIIRNSLPKGDAYMAPNGKQYFNVVFWTNIINETKSPLEFTIHFPAHFYDLTNLPGNRDKVFIANDTMTLDKEPLYNYGFTGLKTFLDKHLEKPTTLTRTVEPNASTGFYVIVLRQSTTNEPGGTLRTGLNLQGQNLVYTIARYGGKPNHPLTSQKEMNCGSINLKGLVQVK